MENRLNKTSLDNGIRILTKNMPYAKSVSMGVWVDAGARDERLEEGGLCHLIEHMIFKGTQKRTAFEIAKAFDAIGGQTNAFTTMENTCYHARVMDTHLETMVDILCDIFLNSSFQNSEYEKERPVILQEIGMLEDNPEDYIHVILGQAFWGEHPLGQSVLGSRENLLRFTSQDVKAFFRRFYQPDRIVISAAGNISHDHFVSLVGPAFESIVHTNQFPERKPFLGRNRTTICKRDLEQVHICLGTRGLSMTDSRRFSFSLMNTVLGGNMSSRLFQEIREKRGLAYSVYSFMAAHVDTGMFGAYAAVDPKQAIETIELILKEMRQLKDCIIDADVLHDAKEYTKGNLLLASESVDNQMARLAQNEMHFGRYIPVSEVVDQVEQVTTRDICDVAVDLFQADPMAFALVGPVSDEKPFDQLRSL
ncbi:MAG: insulinase family protein [Deltaproteobacteria bacterium]|nr:insulinase family protein [Deltaproteobacteria bacterium]